MTEEAIKELDWKDKIAGTLYILGVLGTIVGVVATPLCVVNSARGREPVPIEGLTVSGLILVVSVAAWILSTSYMNKKDAIKDEAAKGPTLFEAFICQAIIFLLFELLLDMGPMRVERAARYSYLGYLAGAAIIFFRRRKAMTRSDYLFLKWAWIPIWVLGIPCVFYLFFSRDAFW